MDGLKIAQHFSAGVRNGSHHKVPLGTTDDGQISFVPDGTQTDQSNHHPSTEVLGYFRVSLPGQKQKPLRSRHYV